MPIVLIPKGSSVMRETVEAVHPDASLVACDFYIDKIEEGQHVPGGYEIGRILNIDHHAPTARMSQFVSSTNLAIDRVRQCGLPAEDSYIVINHTDCDSILSAAIMSGNLAPDDNLGSAAIAADHTGKEDKLADMLQGIQHLRDVELSLRNVKLMLSGRPIDEVAENGLADRKRKRDQASNLVEHFLVKNNIFYAPLEEDTDTEFFPSLLPQAALILLSIPSRQDPACSIMKLRLGRNAPEGFSIHDLKMQTFDPGYGGRWNAGANKRAGGTTIPLEAYVQWISNRMEQY